MLGRVVDGMGNPIDGKGPIKGETYVAPAFAASRACPAENIKVQLVLIPLSEKYLNALTPSSIIGTLTTICECNEANFSPSLTIPSKSTEITSADTSPLTKLQMLT